MRTLSRALFVMLAALAVHGHAPAQEFPTRTVTLVVPFPPGGTTDVIARTLAQHMSQELKQSVIVENRAGAGGNVGTEHVARSQPDGHTLLVSTAGPLAINPHLYSRIGYDPIKGLTPIAYLASVPIMFVAHPDTPFKTVADVIAYAKANPGKLNYASQGNGTTSHLTMELLKTKAGIELVHVPYKGSAPATADLIGGVVPLMFDNSPTTFPHVKANRMRALAIASKQRVKGMEDIPTIAETVKDFESVAWFGLVGPAGIPAPVVERLNAVVNQVLKKPEVREKFAASGVDLIGGTPDEFGAFIRSESAKWGEVVRASGAKVD
ncbi:MAG TPA: tripartite tricarboxylate transporter substrate binding protein [Burkholderiaceae bacterium]|jgi:tripartite-type tricarboxylate transporter receptor subunit TctC|nr:tripartite tricarboxylate transporter substrate binding protein [Burkholderiaceae bacterium]